MKKSLGITGHGIGISDHLRSVLEACDEDRAKEYYKLAYRRWTHYDDGTGRFGVHIETLYLYDGPRIARHLLVKTYPDGRSSAYEVI